MAIAADRSCSQRGFTLVELLVVLTLVGILAAVAFPNLERMTDSVTRATGRDHILDQVAVLGRRALHQGRNYVVFGTGEGAPASRDELPLLPDEYEAYAIEVPEGWEVHLDPPLVVRSNGVCLGGALVLRHLEAEDSRIELEPPFCRVDPDA